jgi:hypothetical protein
MADKDAEEIGRLFEAAGGMAAFPAGLMTALRKAKAEAIKSGKVTDKRKFSRDISPSRNADCCCWCKQEFAAGQTRYPILNWDSNNEWTFRASLCMDCFKRADEAYTTKLDRNSRQCKGCGEPMLTVTNARQGQWFVCSNRCYQRVYRKRRHGRSSVVQWKAHLPRCKCCREFMEKRSDAKFCSDACRQQSYRKRAAERILECKPVDHPHSDRPNWRPGDSD